MTVSGNSFRAVIFPQQNTEVLLMADRSAAGSFAAQLSI
jgi:hypothetical protein